MGSGHKLSAVTTSSLLSLTATTNYCFTPQLSGQWSQALCCHYKLSAVTNSYHKLLIHPTTQWAAVTSSPLSLTATTNYCFTPQLSGQRSQALHCHYKLSAVTNSYHKLLIHPTTQWAAVTSSPLSLTVTTNYCFTPQLSGQRSQALCCHYKLSAVTNSYHKLLIHPTTQWAAVTSSPLSLTATTTTASPLNSVGSGHKLSAVTNSYHKLLLHPSTQWAAVTSSPLSLQALCCH